MSKVDPPWLPTFVVFLVLFGFGAAGLGHMQYPDPDYGTASFFEKVGNMPPNAIGDLLAGVFSPLAFFAAVVALLMQSRELKESRREAAKSADALRFQANILELRENGEHLEELLIAIVKHASSSQVCWVFRTEFQQLDTGRCDLSICVGDFDFRNDTIDKAIVGMGVEYAILLDSLQRQGHANLIQTPSEKYYQPTAALGYCRKIMALYPDLSPAKRQRVDNLEIKWLLGVLEQVCSCDWWMTMEQQAKKKQALV